MYKFCILTAGEGTRNRYVQFHDTNKALLWLGDRPALAHIIDKIPKEIQIVVAVGYKSKMVRDFIEAVYPDRPVTFVYTSKYSGEGSGPGYSLLQCSPSLQCPFIYMACDTIVTDKIPQPTKNWIGVSVVSERLPYLTLRTRGKSVQRVYDKGDKDATYLASIGLVGVKDYKDFWEGLANPTIVQGEHQDTSGINALIPKNLYWKYFNWQDIGTTEGYEKTKRRFDKSVPG